MDRITRGHLESVLARFCKIGGFRVATAWNDVGGFQFSHDIGGWNVERVSSKGGGVSQPFGARRHSAREMYDLLNFAFDAFYEKGRK